MQSKDIRETFLKYFEEKKHKRLPSSSLIPSDPTVLLTIAGMLQFKPIFLGLEEPAFSKATTCQKCVRVNDIEEVGKTSRHHTFFEMLGNFSFGDYFKEDAIRFAWELLTVKLKIKSEKLKIAVFKDDNEAHDIWTKKIGISEDRIYRLDAENNFWAAGPTGPCGPCSEIYYDFGEDKSCGPDCKLGCDCERYLEIWNLVFIQYNRDEAGNLDPLPKKNIDTGMGLERIARVLQNAATNFDTDLFKPLLLEINKHSKKKNISATRIVADHCRAMTYLIADGITPSNEARGYVLRRLIRRAVMYCKKLGIEDPFLWNICELVIESGQHFYPELQVQERFIKSIIQTEENNFKLTLSSGMEIIDKIITDSKNKNISGAQVFKLHDTYGFPYDLTKEILKEKGYSFDEAQFHKKMEEQRTRARSEAPKDQFLKLKKQAQDDYGTTKFVGYDTLEIQSKIVGIIPEENYIILNKTPFYPEGGGQVGDIGKINKTKVLDTLGTIGGVIFHKVEHSDGFKVGDTVSAQIDFIRRNKICPHHTATHLLHAALRIVLGQHVKQAGSYVGSDRLRFDFTHHKALSKEQVLDVEKIVNQNINKGISLNIFCTNYEAAKQKGVTALFDQKYGNEVRVVEVGDISRELCGGCHAKNTKELKSFKIIKEGGIQSGVRRIEAVVGEAVLEYQRKKEFNDSELKKKELEKEEAKAAAKAKVQGAAGLRNEAVKSIKEIKGIKVLAYQADKVDIKGLRALGDKIRDVFDSGIVLLAASFEGKAFFLALVSDDLVKKGYKAGDLVKIMAKVCGGGGGGRPNKAEAGGRDPSKIEEALKKAIESI